MPANNDPPKGNLPSGVIMMWSGTTSDIPDGWVLCDGNNGTPDLRDRFVPGAGGQYASGDTGGADSVALTVSELPSHSHDYFVDSAQGGDQIPERNQDKFESDLNSTQATGNDEAHENRPPYHALAYIMKE